MTRVPTVDKAAGVPAAERELDAGIADDHATKQDGLDWEGFLSRYFPERRRHDLEAITAYAAYRSSRPVDGRPSVDVARPEVPEPVGAGSKGADAWEDEGGATL